MSCALNIADCINIGPCAQGTQFFYFPGSSTGSFSPYLDLWFRCFYSSSSLTATWRNCSGWYRWGLTSTHIFSATSSSRCFSPLSSLVIWRESRNSLLRRFKNIFTGLASRVYLLCLLTLYPKDRKPLNNAFSNGFHISQHAPRKLRQGEVFRTSWSSFLQVKLIIDALVPANSFLPDFFFPPNPLFPAKYKFQVQRVLATMSMNRHGKKMIGYRIK